MSVAGVALGSILYYSAATIGSQLRGCCCCWKGSRDIANPSSSYFQILVTAIKLYPFVSSILLQMFVGVKICLFREIVPVTKYPSFYPKFKKCQTKLVEMKYRF
ncbi:hypothetical protein C5167_041496 [Papaver somniferum]|nr:hypothetical protein C5167_041496 [Papaver somniferum]